MSKYKATYRQSSSALIQARIFNSNAVDIFNIAFDMNNGGAVDSYIELSNVIKIELLNEASSEDVEDITDGTV